MRGGPSGFGPVSFISKILVERRLLRLVVPNGGSHDIRRSGFGVSCVDEPDRRVALDDEAFVW